MIVARLRIWLTLGVGPAISTSNLLVCVISVVRVGAYVRNSLSNRTFSDSHSKWDGEPPIFPFYAQELKLVVCPDTKLHETYNMNTITNGDVYIIEKI